MSIVSFLFLLTLADELLIVIVYQFTECRLQLFIDITVFEHYLIKLMNSVKQIVSYVQIFLQLMKHEKIPWIWI